MPRSRASIGPVRNPATHEAVLSAAEQLLLELGYGGFSMELVSRRARASKPTLYKWWPSKAELMAELHQRQEARLAPVPDLGSLHDELLQLCQALWHLWRDTTQGEALRGIIAEAQHAPTLRQQLREALMPARLQAVQAVFERASKRGEVAASADIGLAIELMTGFHWYRLLTDDPPDTVTLTRLVTQIVAMVRPSASTPASAASSGARSARR